MLLVRDIDVPESLVCCFATYTDIHWQSQGIRKHCLDNLGGGDNCHKRLHA